MFVLLVLLVCIAMLVAACWWWRRCLWCWLVLVVAVFVLVRLFPMIFAKFVKMLFVVLAVALVLVLTLLIGGGCAAGLASTVEIQRGQLQSRLPGKWMRTPSQAASCLQLHKQPASEAASHDLVIGF